MDHGGSYDRAARHKQPSTSVCGGREDCWSEGATETLVEAWGDRYVKLNRGNLRQNDWREVADTVNSRQGGIKPRRTDAQCKNRVDTLKKKYKLENSKSPPSKWQFFHRMDSLIGGTRNSAADTSDVRSTKPNPNKNNKNLLVYLKSNEKLPDERGDEEVLVGRKQHRVEAIDLPDEGACNELAQAILKFGEIYERIENSKQQQMMELEKQRMEFTKDLELQQLNMLMDAQLELRKLKRKKHRTDSGNKS